MAKKPKFRPIKTTIGDKEFNIVTVKDFQSSLNCLYLEAIKNKNGTDTTYSTNLKLLCKLPDIKIEDTLGLFLYLREEEPRVLFVGSTKLDYIVITKITKLNVPQPMLLLEEYKDGYRLTFSSALIENLYDLGYIQLKEKDD